MANFAQLWLEDMRLVMLRTLAGAEGYSCNDSILQTVLASFAHKCSRDQVRSALAWLSEQGYLTYEVLETGTYVATINQRGLDVAEGYITVPGVKRPSRATDMGKRAEMENAAIRLYAEGMEIPSISVEIGVSENSLREWKKRAGREWDDARAACRKGFVASMETVGARLLRARQISDQLTGDVKGQSRMGLSLNQAVQTMIYDVIGQMQTTGVIDAESMTGTIDQLKGLSLTLARLEQAATMHMKRETEIRKQALTEAAERLGTVAKQEGVSEETIMKIRRDVLGMSRVKTVKAKSKPENPDGLFLPYQQKWILDRSRLKLMEKARQIGLSWSTSYAGTERTAEAGARWDQWVSSRDDLQARLFIEDCKMWAKVLHVAAEDLGERVIDEEKKISAYVLHFASGRRIHSMSSNPDAQAGKRGGRILDEFALHPDPRKLWSIAYPGITWGGNMEVISTHRGSANFFNLIIREARERNNPKKISLHRVTLQDALDQGFLWKLQQSLPDGHEVLDYDEAGYFDFIKSGCADEESFQQEYCCVPADDASAFLEYDLIAGCEYPSDEAWEQECSTWKPEGRLFAGLDIGRKKDLTVLWVLELLGDVLYTRQIIELRNMSKPDQEKVIWPVMAKLNRCCLDYTGLGIGWGDDAVRQFGEYRVECVTFSGRVKETLAYPVRGKMEDKKLRIPYRPEIRADLRAVTKETTAAGNIRFTAERSENGHADRFWALALAIHAAGTPGAAIEFQTAGSSGQYAGYGSSMNNFMRVSHG